MTSENKRQGSDLFIVDNSDDDWKVQNYLREWTDIAHTFDIATGYFEIGALLALDGQWQKLDKLRILIGDEMTKRTKKALVDARLGGSIIGSAATVKDELTRILKQTKADELMINAMIYDHAARLHSYEIVADIRRQRTSAHSV